MTAFHSLRDQVLDAWSRRNIDGVWLPNGAAAVRHVLDRLPPGATVITAGSTTLDQLGLPAALRAAPVRYLKPEIRAEADAAERHRLRRLATTADVSIGSANAISATGEIVCIDSTGSRSGAYAYGAGRVYLICGRNKLVPTFEDALRRARHVAAVTLARLEGADTPCVREGTCDTGRCFFPARECGKILIIEKEAFADRLHVLLVDEDLGF